MSDPLLGNRRLTGVSYDVGSHGESLLPGDIDGDGDTDLLVEGYRSYVLLVNDGVGGFTTRTVADELGWYIDLGDFDGDGVADLLSGSGSYPYREDGKTVVIRFGDGTGRFGPPTLVSSTYDDGEVWDVNADGLDDVVLPDLVRVSDGAGGVTDHPLPSVLDREGGRVVVDLNEDGHLDVVIRGVKIGPPDCGCDDHMALAVYAGNAAGGFDPPVVTLHEAVDGDYFDGGGGFDEVADFDEDGHVELLTDYTGLILGNGTLTPARSRRLALDGSDDWCGGMRTAVDLDGDGHVDLLRPGDYVDEDADDNDTEELEGARHVRVHFGDGTGEFPSVREIELGAVVSCSAIVEDLDGDADPDVVIAFHHRGGTRRVAVSLNAGDGAASRGDPSTTTQGERPDDGRQGKRKNPRAFGRGNFTMSRWSFFADAFPASDYSARNTTTLSAYEYYTE